MISLADLGKLSTNVSDEEIWRTRMTMKNKLVDYIHQTVPWKHSWKNQGDPSRIVSLMDKINPNALLIGFGRRLLLPWNVLICCLLTWNVASELITILIIEYNSFSQVRLTHAVVPVRFD